MTRVFDLSDKNHNIIFEVTSELDDFSKYLDEEVIKKNYNERKKRRDSRSTRYLRLCKILCIETS